MDHDPKLLNKDWFAAFCNCSDRLIEVSSELHSLKSMPLWRRIIWAVSLK